MFERASACCFSGHRPEKFPFAVHEASAGLVDLRAALEAAVRSAVHDGYRLFVTGMSRGFDLWAAETVLHLRDELQIQLLCAVPFDGQPNRWPAAWRAAYSDVLLQADLVHSLAREYTPDCFFVRNCFMVEGSSRLICWHNGTSGGTKFTMQCAKRRGLEIVNLADPQLSFQNGACMLP